VTRSGESGVALLEVLVALAILSAGGIAIVSVLGAGLRAEHDARARERTVAAEERVLAAMTLLRREELDLRIGRHTVGEFAVTVQRPEPSVYRIAIGAKETEVEDLVTVVYRSRPLDAP
jgi:Tfp pilus assembly protein PilV